MIKILEELRDEMLEDAGEDKHRQEMIVRGFYYASNRVNQGHAKTENEAKLAMASFADGFCTGFHSGNGSICTR